MQPNLQKGSILLVEDDPDIRESIRILLEYEGYDTYLAQNGEEAMRLLDTATPRPCLILLDVFMPVMNGFEFLSAMNRERKDIIAALPVIILTAGQPDHETVKSARALASGLIKKPIDLDLLLRTVSDLCHKKSI